METLQEHPTLSPSEARSTGSAGGIGERQRESGSLGHPIYPRLSVLAAELGVEPEATDREGVASPLSCTVKGERGTATERENRGREGEREHER